MEFYSWSDPLVIVFCGLGLVLSSIFLKEGLFYLRWIIPTKVKCWFCHYETLIPYESHNSWVCTECEQYNGFNKDGDYNRVIPNQHDIKLNTSCFSYKSTGHESLPKNSLCDECNLKQHLKINALRSFVPINENNYDKEVEHFEKQIEKGFKLCRDCETLISKVLRNLREELSLPKKLSAAVSKINIRGERAIVINIFLSLLIVLSSFSHVFNFTLYVDDIFKKSSYGHDEIRYYSYIIFYHPFTSFILTNIIQILIGTGIFINSIGFYQTDSPFIFLNVLSWILMFFLTLYPNGYDDVIYILKIVSSVISICISVAILLGNMAKRNKQKPSLWEKKKSLKMPSSPSLSRAQSRLGCDSNPNTLLKTTNVSDVTSRLREKSPFGISTSMNSLNIGLRQRGKSVIKPPKFNPFSSPSPSEKNYTLNSTHFSKGSPNADKTLMNSISGFGYYDKSYSVLGKAGAGGSTLNHYEPSLTPPSAFEGYDPTDAVTTIPYNPYEQQFYPYSPTLAYYFTSPHYPKISPVQSPSALASSTPIQQGLVKQGYFLPWTSLHYLQYLGNIFLVSSHLFLLWTYLCSKD